MSISVVDQADQLAAQTVSADRQQASMDKEAFLTLLVAQISNQDPMNAQGSEQFMEQISQFSMLEQMMNLNEGVNRLALGQISNNNQEALTFVGRDIVSGSDQIERIDGAPVEFQVRPGGPASELTVRIYDSEGELVRTMDGASSPDGAPVDLTWDGLDEEGGPTPDGRYRIEVEGASADGEVVLSQVRTRGRVTGVRFDEGYPELLVGDRRVKMSEVVEVE
ncbi:MAG: flagellar hook assembly protein FlgD [Bradymonadia bacterium]